MRSKLLMQKYWCARFVFSRNSPYVFLLSRTRTNDSLLRMYVHFEPVLRLCLSIFVQHDQMRSKSASNDLYLLVSIVRDVRRMFGKSIWFQTWPPREFMTRRSSLFEHEQVLMTSRTHQCYLSMHVCGLVSVFIQRSHTGHSLSLPSMPKCLPWSFSDQIAHVHRPTIQNLSCLHSVRFSRLSEALLFMLHAQIMTFKQRASGHDVMAILTVHATT